MKLNLAHVTDAQLSRLDTPRTTPKSRGAVYAERQIRNLRHYGWEV